jgi:hypothetical protein
LKILYLRPLVFSLICNITLSVLSMFLIIYDLFLLYFRIGSVTVLLFSRLFCEYSSRLSLDIFFKCRWPYYGAVIKMTFYKKFIKLQKYFISRIYILKVLGFCLPYIFLNYI